MADKDLGERDVLKQCLPKFSVLICLFHTLRTFRREIICEKMGITAAQRILCLELVQKMAYAYSDAEYENLYEQFRRDAPREVLEYFNRNWHPIRGEWVMGLNSSCGNFLNFTNNRLESINGKLKQVIDRHSTLEEFVTNFFIILTALRTERDHKAAIMLQKVKVYPFSPDSPKGEYSALLTPYASPFVIKQIDLSSKVNVIRQSDGQYLVQTSKGNNCVTLTECDCIFRKSMLLPCCHIFALRSKIGQPLYETNLCDKRWTAVYYRSTQRLFTNSHSDPGLVISELSSRGSTILSQHEKFRKTFKLTSELVSVASEASNVHFQRRIELLKQLIDHWRCGNEVGLVEIENGSEDKLQDDDNGCDFGGHQQVDAQNSLEVATTKTQKLIIPPRIKKRGRPKGNELTTIGLPKKRSKKDSSRKPCSFSRLHTSEKEKVILSWFVDKEIINGALDGKLIEEEEVECRPERVPNSVLDKSIDVCLVRRYFSCDAWMLLESVLKNKSKKTNFAEHAIMILTLSRHSNVNLV